MKTSNSKPGPSASEFGKIQQESDDHSDKKVGWQPFRSAGDQSGKKIGWQLFKKEGPTIQLEGVPKGYSYNQLSVATKGFRKDSKLGQGGSGSVYAGVLPSGIRVAIKKINSDSRPGKGVKVFKDEVSIISTLRHRNLIELWGWCEDVAKKEYLLVYELMPNGSLDGALFGQVESTTSLSWPQRFKVLTGTADALAYLHEGLKKQVIHRDIKCSNILLDEDWNAKVGDFGIARLVDHEREAAITGAIGTPGYIPPEVFEDGRVTDKADVYGFGVVVLEVACGQRVLPDDSRKEGLVDWVWRFLSKGKDALLRTVDERLRDYDKKKMKVVLLVGLACCHPDPLKRPSMRHVVQMLAGDVQVPPIPTSKPTPVLRFDTQISVTDLLSFKAGSSSRSRPTYNSNSAQASTVTTSATGTSLNSSLISRMVERTIDTTSFPERRKGEEGGNGGACTANSAQAARADLKGFSPLSVADVVDDLHMKATEYMLKFNNTNVKMVQRMCHEDHLKSFERL